MQTGFVMKYRSLSKGEGEGGRGQLRMRIKLEGLLNESDDTHNK